MSGLQISLNGKHLVTVSTEGLNILTIRVHGDVVDPEFAAIDVSGGYYGGENNTKHLIWLSEREIVPADEIQVIFLKETSTSEAGKTLEELYREEDAPMGPSQSIDEIFKDLAQKLKMREQFTFLLESSPGEVINSRTKVNDHCFSFSVLWDWTRPESAQVSLSSNSLESIKYRQKGTEHARFRLQFGQDVKLRIDS